MNQISDNEIYLLIKYIKSVLWRVAKCLSYIEEARCVKVKMVLYNMCKGVLMKRSDHQYSVIPIKRNIDD